MSLKNGHGGGRDGRFSHPNALNGSVHLFANGTTKDSPSEAEQMAAILQRRAAELATPPPVEPEGSTLHLLIFRLNEERYAIRVSHVREIHPLRQVTSVPRTPEFVVGVFSARGRLLSVIDLHAFWGLSKMQITKDSKIIVVTGESSVRSGNAKFELGLLADEVEDVRTIFEHNLTPMLSGQMDNQAESTLGITSDMLVVLNLEALLQNKRLIVHEEI